MKRLDWNFLIKCHGWGKQEYYVDKMTEALLESGDEYIMISDNDYEEALQVFNAHKKEEEKLFNTTRLNNEGIALEKEGRIEDAIKIYEQNIEIGYPASHSYERLMILYRKCKDYENEIRVIRLAIDVFSKLNERKAEHMIERYPEFREDIINSLLNNKELKDNKTGRYIFFPYDVKKYEKRLEKSNKLMIRNQK